MSSALDIALSGRMATSGLMTFVDGSLAVAHAITTHAVEPQDVGLVHRGGRSRSNGLRLPRHAGVLGRGLLSLRESQLEAVTVEPRVDRQDRQRGVCRVETKGPRRCNARTSHVGDRRPLCKTQSFAADNPADFAIVSFSDVPISLANGFEQPIERAGKAGGYRRPRNGHCRATGNGSIRPMVCTNGPRHSASTKGRGRLLATNGRNR